MSLATQCFTGSVNLKDRTFVNTVSQELDLLYSFRTTIERAKTQFLPNEIIKKANKNKYMFLSYQLMRKVVYVDLFFMSASLRPSLGVSTVRAIALKPAFSALLTSCATTFLSL